MSKQYRVCIVGLGAMGMGAAFSCLRNGIKTYGVDIVESNLEKLANAGAAGVARDANEFANDLDAVMLLVVNSIQMRSILFGESKLADNLKPGTVVLMSSTISPGEACSIGSELMERGLLVLDAPVSGGLVKAAAGEMTIMASGSKDAFERAQSLLDAIACKVYDVGAELGKGTTVKIIHQLLAGVHIAVAAEAMGMAAKAKIPLDLIYDIVTHAAGNSWMFENRMRHVLDGDYSPLSKVDIFVKDLGLVVDAAKSLKYPLALAPIALNMFTTASARGLGNEDDSAVIKIFPGLDLP